jgi:hypothetical protein
VAGDQVLVGDAGHPEQVESAPELWPIESTGGVRVDLLKGEGDKLLRATRARRAGWHERADQGGQGGSSQARQRVARA